jgi:hypothetical protein
VDAPLAEAPLPNRDLRTLTDALEAFANTTGLEANLLADETAPLPNYRADAVIAIRGKENYCTFFAEIKQVHRPTTLGTLKERFTPLEGKGLLVTPYLTTALATHCRQIDLPFIDTAGNAYLNAPGLFVFVKGEKRPEHATMLGTGGGGTATALRVVFVLLCRQDLLNAPYRAIVDAAGVALGAVGWVFYDLEGRGYVAGGKRQGNRRILEPKRLFEEWVTNYPIKLRPKLNPRRFRATKNDWWKEALLPKGAYWGGEVAADRLTNYVKPATFTIYLDTGQARENLAALVTTHRLRADPAGDIEMLDTFWHFDVDPNHADLVPPILVYADLVATLDTRNLEAANLVRERFIDNAQRPT